MTTLGATDSLKQSRMLSAANCRQRHEKNLNVFSYRQSAVSLTLKKSILLHLPCVTRLQVITN